MMLHMVDFPRHQRAVYNGIDPRMTLPSTDPGGEVVDGTQRGDTQRRAVHASLERLVTAVTDNRQHMFVPLTSNARCMPRLTARLAVRFRALIIQFYRVGSDCWTSLERVWVVDRGSRVELTEL
jgi:hypothetical protein